MSEKNYFGYSLKELTNLNPMDHASVAVGESSLVQGFKITFRGDIRNQLYWFEHFFPDQESMDARLKNVILAINEKIESGRPKIPSLLPITITIE